MKRKHFIDSHKLITGAALLLMMAIFNRWDNVTAWVYFGLHGSYGILWALKSRFFPDKTWEQATSIGWGLYAWAGLTLYWIAPLIIIAGDVQAPYWLLGGCVFLYGIGVFFHFASDMQKSMALTHRPGVLITEGLWALCRNPNYFGELLIYLSFSLLALHWAPFVVMAIYLALEWLPNMRRKDESLSRYPDFADYKARTKKLIPFVW